MVGLGVHHSIHTINTKMDRLCRELETLSSKVLDVNVFENAMAREVSSLKAWISCTTRRAIAAIGGSNRGNWNTLRSHDDAYGVI